MTKNSTSSSLQLIDGRHLLCRVRNLLLASVPLELQITLVSPLPHVHHGTAELRDKQQKHQDLTSAKIDNELTSNGCTNPICTFALSFSYQTVGW